MSYLTDKMFLIEVMKGNVPKHSIVHKFGANASVGTSIEDVSAGSTVYPWPTTAAQLDAVSTDNVEDVAVGGGARQITIEGLDSSWAEVEDTLTMNGTATVGPTTQSFIRVHRAYVSKSGDYCTTTTGGNEGTITVSRTGGGGTQVIIPVKAGTGMGQTQASRYTIPAGKTGYLLSAFANVDSSKTCTLWFFKREDADDNTGDKSSRRLQLQLDGVAGSVNFTPQSALGPYPAKTDLWWSAQVSTGSAEVSIDFEILLVDD